MEVRSYTDELVGTNVLAVLKPSTVVYLCHGEKYNSGYLKHCDDENYYFREILGNLSVCIKELKLDVLFVNIWMELYFPFVIIGVVVSGQLSKSTLALKFLPTDVNHSIRRRAILCLRLSYIVSEPNEQIHSNSSPARKDDASLVKIPWARLLELITTGLAFTLNFISLAVHGGYQHIIEINTQFILLQKLLGTLLKEVTVEMIRAEYITKARPMLLFTIVFLWQLTHSKRIWTLIHTANVHTIQYVISVVVLSMTSVWNYTFSFVQVEVANAYHQMPSLMRFLDLNLEDKVLIEVGSYVVNRPEPILVNGPLEELRWSFSHNQPSSLLMGFDLDPG